jgi:hypothetical protein
MRAFANCYESLAPRLQRGRKRNLCDPRSFGMQDQRWPNSKSLTSIENCCATSRRWDNKCACGSINLNLQNLLSRLNLNTRDFRPRAGTIRRKTVVTRLKEMEDRQRRNMWQIKMIGSLDFIPFVLALSYTHFPPMSPLTTSAVPHTLPNSDTELYRPCSHAIISPVHSTSLPSCVINHFLCSLMSSSNRLLEAYLCVGDPSLSNIPSWRSVP